MPEAVAGGDMARVAVYLDFDNIVISRYDQVHGRKLVPEGQGARTGRRQADDGHRRRRSHHRFRVVVRHPGADEGLRRLVGRPQRRLPEPARRPRGRPRAAVPRRRLREERRRYPARRRRGGGHVPVAGPDPRGDRRRRLRLHRPRAAVQAAGPLCGRHRCGGGQQPVAGRRVRRVRHLRRAARHPHRRPGGAEEGHPARRSRRRPTTTNPSPRIGRPRRRVCWSGRFGSATRRTTPTGCTTRRSRPR